MKQRIKIGACVLLMVFAALSLAAVLRDLGMIPAAAMEGYVLRDCGGYIGVFGAGDEEHPRELTNIRVDGLPLGDRRELEQGVPAADYSTVLRLLEDYGA